LLFTITNYLFHRYYQYATGSDIIIKISIYMRLAATDSTFYKYSIGQYLIRNTLYICHLLKMYSFSELPN